jgi:hypothetical protein
MAETIFEGGRQKTIFLSKSEKGRDNVFVSKWL